MNWKGGQRAAAGRGPPAASELLPREEPGKLAVGEEDLRPGVKLLSLWLKIGIIKSIFILSSREKKMDYTPQELKASVSPTS